MILCAAAFAGAACTDSTAFDNADPRPVGALLYPTSGSTVELFRHSTAKTNFEWERSEGTQQYSVVFYAADKKTELATCLADNNGLNNSLQLAHTELSRIAETAGIAAGGTGEVYWNVATTAGSATQLSATPSRLQLKRYKAALEKPYELFLTGAGSEGGEDFTRAMRMKQDGDRFELYAKIDGAYAFVDRNEDGNKMTIGVDEEGNLTYGDDAVGTAPEGVYRITVDFLESSVKLEKIASLVMMRANNSRIEELEYAGNGTWRSKQPVAMKWDGDDRYRFLAQVDDHTEIWGSTRHDRDASEPSTILGSDPYYAINIDTDADRIEDSYQCCYKFWGRMQGDPATVCVFMQPERFYHAFELDYPLAEVPVVTRLSEPDAGKKLLLSTTDGASSRFAWERPADCPQLKLAQYSVVFTKDAAGEEVISTVGAGWDTWADIRHTDLDKVAEAAGIATSSSGELYWTVETAVEGNTARATEVRKVVLRRFVAQPTVAYITGDGSEYGAQYGKMHVITDEGKHKGKFEIYMRMVKDGRFDLTTDTDPASDAYAKYRFKGLRTGAEIEEDGSAENTFSLDDGIYRLIVDFNADTIGIEKIDRMRFVSLVVRGNNDVALDYLGDGTWGKDDFVPVFKGAWDDDRFNLFARYDGVDLKLGSDERSQGEIDTQPEPGDKKYWVYLTGEKSDWDFYFHCIKSYRANTDKKVDLRLYMNGSDVCAHPYLYIDYKNK